MYQNFYKAMKKELLTLPHYGIDGKIHLFTLQPDISFKSITYTPSVELHEQCTAKLREMMAHPSVN